MNRESQASQRVDYDEIAPSYDERFKVNRLNGVLSALQSLAQEVKAQHILEVGCGTGRWLADLNSERRHLWGLDPSTGMLHEARKRDGNLRLVQGRGARCAFRREMFDLIFCVNAIHHFDAPRGFIEEAHRMLESDGTLAVIGSDPHGGQEDWYVYQFFEGTYETDLKRFPSWETIENWMEESGFIKIGRYVAERVVDDKVGREVLEDPFLQKDACSQLALLADEAYAGGVRRIKAALASAEAVGETLTFPTKILLAMIVGTKDGKRSSI